MQMQIIPHQVANDAIKIVEENSSQVEINGGDGITGAVYSGSILIFGGAGLLLAYMLNKKKENK